MDLGDKSHVSLIRDDAETIESWHLDPTAENWRDRLRGRVHRSASPWTIHTPGTPVEILELLYPEVLLSKVWASAESKVGRQYDFRALLGFVPGLRWFWRDDPKKWFCSHQLADDCCLDRKHRLFNRTVPTYKIDPTYACSSPWLLPLGLAQNPADFFSLISQIL